MEDAHGLQPHITSQDVMDLTYSLYGMKILSVKQLNGYADQNFHITVDMDVNENDNVSKLNELGYIFKLLNSSDSQKEQDHVFAVIRLLEHLRSKGFKSPRLVNTKSGQLSAEHHLPNKDKTSTAMHLILMCEYIDGEIAGAEKVTAEFAYEGGLFLAELHANMKGFDGQKLIRHGFLWSMTQINKLRHYLHLVEDEDHRRIVTEVLDKWDSLQPVIAKLPKGTIHSDFSDQNILVKRSGKDLIFTGVIDFQEADYECTVYDIGIYIMYLMCWCEENHIEIAGHCLRGFIARRKLTEVELNLVYYCAAARFTQSLVLGLYYYSKRKDPYLLTTQKGGWNGLIKLWERPSEEVLKYWLSGKS